MIRRLNLHVAAVATLATACATVGNPRVKPAVEEQAIRARLSDMMAIENARDMAQALTFYAPDAVVQSPNMPEVKGVAAIRAMYSQQAKPGTPKMVGAIIENTVAVAGSGDLAWDHGTARTIITLPTGEVVALSKHLIVWKKIDGVWYIAGMSWSSDSPVRAAAPAASTTK